MDIFLVQKNSCFLAFPINWPCLSFNGQIFCESVMFLFVQKLLKFLLSVTSFAIHLSIFRNCVAIVFRFVP